MFELLTRGRLVALGSLCIMRVRPLRQMLAFLMGLASISAASPSVAAVQTYAYDFVATTTEGPVINNTGSFALAYDAASGIFTLQSLTLQIGSTNFDLSNASLFQGSSILVIGGNVWGVGGIAPGAFDDFWLTLFYTPGPLPSFTPNSFQSYISQGSLWSDAWGQLGEINLIQSGVPEPSTWIMVLLGFSALGAAMRRRRALLQIA